MIEVICNDRLGKKIRVKCNEDDTVGDLKKLLAAQTGTRPEKIRIQKWYTIFKDHITLQDYEIHDGMGLELYYNCAFRRARLPGLRWSSLRYARLTAPRCLSQEEAFYLKSIVDNRTGLQKRRACGDRAIHPVAGPKQLRESECHSMQPRRRENRPGDCCWLSRRRFRGPSGWLALALLVRHTHRHRGGGAPSLPPRAFLGKALAASKRTRPAQASASSFGHHARPAIYHAACLLRG